MRRSIFEVLVYLLFYEISDAVMQSYFSEWIKFRNGLGDAMELEHNALSFCYWC